MKYGIENSCNLTCSYPFSCHHRLCAIKNGTINKHDRIAQFEVVPSQKATWWQKLKWLFSSGVKLVKVDNLQENSRGGFGSTGTK